MATWRRRSTGPERVTLGTSTDASARCTLNSRCDGSVTAAMGKHALIGGSVSQRKCLTRLVSMAHVADSRRVRSRHTPCLTPAELPKMRTPHRTGRALGPTPAKKATCSLDCAHNGRSSQGGSKDFELRRIYQRSSESPLPTDQGYNSDTITMPSAALAVKSISSGFRRVTRPIRLVSVSRRRS